MTLSANYLNGTEFKANKSIHHHHRDFFSPCFPNFNYPHLQPVENDVQEYERPLHRVQPVLLGIGRDQDGKQAEQPSEACNF